jgi:hypothetical protein
MDVLKQQEVRDLLKEPKGEMPLAFLMPRDNPKNQGDLLV